MNIVCMCTYQSSLRARVCLDFLDYDRKSRLIIIIVKCKLFEVLMS
jgi:hypothetical protein